MIVIIKNYGGNINKKLITGIITILLLETAVISSNGRATQERSPLPVLDGTILYVGGTGPNNYTAIQDAVDDAANGYTIYVFDDSSPYYENVVIDKSINLIGADKHTTIIDGGGSGNVVNISADYVAVECFTIRNAGNTYLLNWVNPGTGLYVFADAGVYVLSDYSYIQGNIIKDNPIHGIHIHDNSDQNVISNNMVTNISDPTASVGIFLQFSSYNVISGNTIINNSKHGIHLLWDCNNNTILDNTITNNNCALEISGNLASINNVITRNTIINNRNLGVYLYIQCLNTVISENIIINNNMVGLVLQQTCSGSSISNNTIANHNLGIVAELFVEDITISNNIITNHSENGIEIRDFADNCIITGNTIVNNNNNGIFMMESDNNIFYENIFTDNQRGIYSRATSYNLFYHNTFINNLENAYDQGINFWNNGTEGNFWDDYTGIDGDGDGIGDIPYDIPGDGNQDSYPLIHPYGSVINLDTGEVFLTIQGAIDDAETLDGHTIYVRNGTYCENIFINKIINLVGEDRYNTIIDGAGGEVVVTSYADWVNISKFTIQNSGNNDFDSGIHINANYNVISSCIIRNNKNGIYISRSFYNLISKNVVTNNSIGIWLNMMSSYNDITNCEIYNNSDKGIFLLEFCENCNITNCNVNNNNDGILSIGSISCNFLNCTVYDNNVYGIFLLFSEDCLLRDNTISNNSFNFCVESQICDFYHDIDTSNMINGKTIHYLIEQSNITVDETSNAGYVGLVSCANITVKNLDVWGIVLSNTMYSTISNVTAHDSKYGIHFSPSSNNSITNCHLSNNYKGIYFGSYDDSSLYNEISDNLITNNDKGIHLNRHSHNNIIWNNTIISNINEGIHLETSSYNNIIKNRIINNGKGFYLTDYMDYMGPLDGSCDNIITENAIADNNYGIYIHLVHQEHDSPDNNYVYNNNFEDNNQNAYDECINNWDDGRKGNYWDDYSGEDADGDGIGDTPYDIPGGSNQDCYPLMYPWPCVSGDLDFDGDVDLSDLAQLLAHYGTPSGATYWMGDLDGDGDVDLADLAELLGNYGYPN